MVVFVSRCGTWIVAQECDLWIVFELIDDEESIQICDEIRGRWDAKGGGQNSGAVTRTREAPAPRFQAIARVHVSVVEN